MAGLKNSVDGGTRAGRTTLSTKASNRFPYTEDARKRKKEHQSNEKTGITHTICHAAENSAGVLFPEECLSINIDIEFHCQIINCS